MQLFAIKETDVARNDGDKCAGVRTLMKMMLFHKIGATESDRRRGSKQIHQKRDVPTTSLILKWC